MKQLWQLVNDYTDALNNEDVDINERLRHQLEEALDADMPVPSGTATLERTRPSAVFPDPEGDDWL
jgi:hypothetical protein